jgi:translation initiation factor 2 subunit 2
MTSTADSDDPSLLWGKKKRQATRSSETVAIPLSTDADYTYDYLLNRIPRVTSLSESKIIIPTPILSRVGRRTRINNFGEIARSINRLPGHMTAYVRIELGCPASLGDDFNHLTLRGTFKQEHIEKIIKTYIHKFVICKTCKKYTTTMKKEIRLEFVVCESCSSKHSVEKL